MGKIAPLVQISIVPNGQILNKHLVNLIPMLIISVTRLGDLLDFGQIFNAFGNN